MSGKELFLIFFGGGIGAALRYCAVYFMEKSSIELAFPLDIFLVNVLGCFCIGLCVPVFASSGVKGGGAELFLITGILGGFTTFSTFSLQTVSLLEVGRPLVAVTYAIGSLLVGLLAVLIGIRLSRFF